MFCNGSYSIPLAYDILNFVLRGRDGYSKFEEMGFPRINNRNLNALRSGIFQLLLNPVPPLCTEIKSYTNALLKRFYYGFHIRMGGQIAVARETKNFLLESDLHAFISMMQKQMKERHQQTENVTLFVSTDSDRALSLVMQLVDNNTVVQHISGSRGHTSINHLKKHENYENDMVLFSSFLDLFILKDANILISTFGSSFSNLAFTLGIPSPITFHPLAEMQGCSVYTNQNSVHVQFPIKYNTSVIVFSVCFSSCSY